MPNSVFSRLLEGMYMRAVHNSDFPLEKISRSYKLGMTLLTPGQLEADRYLYQLDLVKASLKLVHVQ